MGFPYTFESNFEPGDNSEWDSETDTGSQLDIAHYTDLARNDDGSSPFRGAYCMRIQLTGGTAAATLNAGALDISADGVAYVRFMLWISPDFAATANDTVNIFTLNSSGSTAEVVFGLRVVAATGVINFGIGETAPTSFSAEAAQRGIWHCIELEVSLDAGGGDDGTIDLYVTPEGQDSTSTVAASQVGSLDQGAVTDGTLGISGQLATTTGTLLFDQFVFDDARIHNIRQRYKDSLVVTKNQHIFVGSGRITHQQLLAGDGTDCELSIYDTDTADTENDSNLVYHVTSGVASVPEYTDIPIEIVRGAYVVLAGTTPRGLLKFCQTPYHDAANIRALGRQRKLP